MEAQASTAQIVGKITEQSIPANLVKKLETQYRLMVVLTKKPKPKRRLKSKD